MTRPMIKQLILGAVIAVVLSACAVGPKSAPPPPKVYRTGTLKAEVGSTGDVFGSEVERVTILSDDTIQEIQISIPLPPDQVDEVEVVSTSGNEVIQLRDAEIRPSAETGGTGVTIYLPPGKKLQFRLRLIDAYPEN